MADEDRSIRVRLLAEYQSYVQGMRIAAAETKNFGKNVSGLGTAGKADVEKFGRAALLMSGGLAVGFGLAAKAAIDWESAWAGVEKTVDPTTVSMAALEEGLRDLAKELPATHAEIAAVAAAAGALGIQGPAIESFTKTMIDLGETTDLTADQAATSMAKIANVMQTPQTEFERMGSTLVELGNNGASTESEILALAERIAAAGEIAGLSEADVFAFASTLTSVGVEAEAGGTALSKVFTRVRDSVIDGGESLETFARVAGTSAEEFAASFRADPASAIETFIAGLGRMNAAGESTSGVFKDLELNDERLKRALLSTATAGDLLTESIAMGRTAWEENNALQTEAEKRYGTTSAQMEMLRNQIVDMGIDIGSVLLPALNAAVDVVGQLVLGFTSLPDGAKLAIGGVVGMGTAVVGATAGAALLITKVKAARDALIGMGAAGKVAAAGLPWLIAAAAAIATVSLVLGENAKKAKEAEERTKGFTDAIREAGDAATGTQNRVADLAKETPAFAELLDETSTSIDDVTAALSGSESEFQAFKDGLIADAEAAGVSNDAMATAVFGIDQLRTAAVAAVEGEETLARVLGDTGTAADGTAGDIEGLGGEFADTTADVDAATQALKDHADALRAQFDPLFAMQDALSDEEAARAKVLWLTNDSTASAGELADAQDDLARAMVDTDSAALGLAAAVADGSVSMEGARIKLDEWVASGRITATQAAVIAWNLGVAKGKADEYAGGDYAANVSAPGLAGVLADLESLKEIFDYLRDNLSGSDFSGGSFGSPGAAAGGVHQGMTWVGEEGPELVNFGSPSRVFPHGESMAMAGSMFHRGDVGQNGALISAAASSVASYDYSRSSSFSAPITVVTAKPQDAAGALQFRLRRIALQVAS